VGTNSDGLIRINVQNNQPLNNAVIDRFIHDKNNPQSITSNFVSAIVRLPGKDLWIGTERGGICKVLHSEGKPVFRAFTEKQGLSNNVVKNIIVENDTTLWITTNNGLNKFNTAVGKFTRFDKANGLPFEDFYYSSANLKNGDIMLTGLDGFCYFNPKNLPSGEMLPGLEFGQFKIFNKEIAVGDTLAGRVLLNKRLSDLTQVKLKYNENVFSIEVASLHFSTFSNHLVEYQLLPLNRQWVVMPHDQRFIYFSGLPPGDYTLRVRASNSFGNWTEPKVLQISIAPPFWKTIPAYIFYVLFIALIVYLVVFFILRYKTLQHNIQIEQLEKNTVKEVNDAKLRLFSNISHEIKTPLTLIAGPVDLLSENFKGNTLVKNNLDIVKRQTKKLARLIDQVHDFQKADANLLKMEYEQFCFDIFINELFADFEFMAIIENKTLLVSGETARVFVSADKDKLEKIFNNLITNAFKHTDKGDTIKIEYSHDNRDLVVKVIDSGHGISKEDLPHIFERFFQSRENNTSYFGGSGIGLAFSKQLVEMHYGYLDAESELNKGTTIVVSLPVVQMDFVENQEGIEEELLLAEKKANVNDKIEKGEIASIQVDKDLLNASVFYAEDNSDLRKFVEGFLSGFFKVKSFSNGQECLDAIENEWPDIIISDLLMPVLNGFELCKRIKSDLKTSHIPVILLTASSAIDNQIQGLANGADAYITKPFNLEHLVKSVEATLRNRKQLRERFQIDIPLTLENAKENGNDHVFLEKLYQLMADNLDNHDLNLDDFAKVLYLNRTHFYQKVKALTNQTPFELLKLYRLKKAAEMLVQNKLNVNEVFLLTGFKSRTHFSKLFKDKYEVTPGKYVEEVSKKFK
jgi:signal transduction histidine kinase/DNA-binding response OmpR family regulator